MGTLTIDVPGRGPNQPVSVKWADGEAWPKKLPAELQVPLDEEITIWATRPGGPSIKRKAKLTAAAPSARVTIAFEEPAPLGLFGFKRSDLPVATSFVATKKRRITRRALLYQLGGGPGRHQGADFGIDELGSVVRVVPDSDGMSHVELGRIDQRVLSRMTSLARKASLTAPSTIGWACNDCGVLTITFTTTARGQTRVVELASDGETVRRIRTPEAETLLLWLLAVKQSSNQTPPKG